MATTQNHQPALNPATSGRQAMNFFERRIWHNPFVCSNCFALLKRNMWADVTKTNGKQLHVEDSWRTTSATDGEALEDPPDSVPSVQPMARQTTACAECGSVQGRKTYDTLSKQDALDRVPDLVDRLRERGFAVDVQAVYDVVDSLKSDPERHADDKRIFATAVALGVKHG